MNGNMLRLLLFTILLLLFFSFDSLAQNDSTSLSISEVDSLSKKEIRKENKKEARLALKNSHERFIINASTVFAQLNTEITFETTNSIFAAKIGLESNLGLPNSKFFANASFIWHITPRSGLYAQYYGINRSDSYTTDQEYVFLDDTIPAGTSATMYFNTRVYSTGYLLTILNDSKAFLGAYFNVFIMGLSSGILSDMNDYDPEFTFTTPLPNFGLVMKFELTKWLNLYGQVGFFSMHSKTFGGSLYNLTAGATFDITRWLGLNISYKEFDVNVFFPEDNINIIVDYNFRGPSFGASFVF